MLWMLTLLLTAPIFVQSEAPKEDPEECKRTIEAFRLAYKTGGEPGRTAAVGLLTKHPCAKSVDALAPMLTAETDAVRIAAAKVLGGFDLPKAMEAVAAAVPPNSQRHEVLEALAKALETLDWEAGAETLNPTLSKHHDKDVLETLHVVVPVLGKLGSSSSVEPLIKLLEHAENEGKRVRAAGVRAAGNPKMLALEAPIRKALQEITGGNEPTADKWDDWWKANRERLFAGATVVYRCRSTGKRWGQKAGEAQQCPHHDKAEKDGLVVKTSLVGSKRP
jgi:HEAT repeat protein